MLCSRNSWGFAVVLVFILAAPGCGEDGLGYTDTPQLPNSPWRVHDRERPQPPKVAPAAEVGEKPVAPPSDAIVLFDGKDLSAWDGGDAKGVEDGHIDIVKTGELKTKQRFGDCQLHVEWATPAKPDGDNMLWGNSGVFMHGRYELQIIESYDIKHYADGTAGAIYGQTPPLANASRKPGEWQTYDIVFTAPKFDGDKLVQPAYFTVYWNGVLVQNHVASLGDTRHREVATYLSHDATGPVMLQNHGSAVRFRNIWVRPLEPEAGKEAKK